MNEDFVLDITNRAVQVSMLLAAPMLLGSLVIGILVSIFQAVTQINEQTLSFIPKILVIIGAMVIFGPWMIQILTTFTRELILEIPNHVVGQ